MSLRDQVLALREQGLSYRKIQAELGCSKGTVAYYCGDGQKEKAYERSRSTRAKRLAKVSKMKEVPCADCGNEFPSVCMDFDHVSGEKIDRVSQLIAHGSWQQVLDEIAKCEVVCSNCHRIRTATRGNPGWVG